MVQDPDGPFVKYPKRLFDAVLRTPMPGLHKDVVSAVIRRTIGHYNQDAAEIGLQLLVDMTGHHKSRLSKTRQDLIREGVLVVVRPETCIQPAVLRLNKDPSTWGAYAVKDRSPDHRPSADCGQHDADGGSASCGEGVSKSGIDPSAACGPMKTPEELMEEHPRRDTPPPRDIGSVVKDSDTGGKHGTGRRAYTAAGGNGRSLDGEF